MPTDLTRPLTGLIRPDGEPLDLKDYERAGGYGAARRALTTLAPGEVTEIVKKSNLKGRGGAGFPTGLKWSFVPMGDKARRPKYLLVNADEMEPATFKDRLLLEGNPHQLLEGVILAAYAIEADISYIFLRAEYHRAEAVLTKAIAEARGAGYIGRNILGTGRDFEVLLHMSAGRYMCGEETGLLNSLEGGRATPRAKPPFPQTSGLFGKPSVVNNVETLCCVPPIVNNGPEWFLGLSRTNDGGTKLYGLSGRVRRTGLWELPLGTTIREVLEERGGGMREGLTFRGLLPGGGSTSFVVPGPGLDVPLDYSGGSASGSRMGTGTMIVLDDKTCPVGFVHNLIEFYARESCGWCTPCREGLPWVEKTLRAMEDGTGRPEDIRILEDAISGLGPGRTYCPLAPGAMEPLQSGLRLFREDFERHIKEGRCPWE